MPPGKPTKLPAKKVWKREPDKKPPLPRELYPAATPPEILKEKAGAEANFSPTARKELSKTPLHWYASSTAIPDRPGVSGQYLGKEKGMEVAGFRGGSGVVPEDTLRHEFAHGWYDRDRPAEDEQARFMRNMQGLSGYDQGADLASADWRREKPLYDRMWGGSVPLNAEADELQARMVEYGAGSSLPEYYRERYWPGLYNPPSPEQARYIEQERMDYPITQQMAQAAIPWYKQFYNAPPRRVAFRYDPLWSAPLQEVDY